MNAAWSALLDVRNRALSSAKFQRWAARSPIFRRIARRRASALFDLCAGFVYSQILAAVVELRLLELLAEGCTAPEAIAPRVGLSISSTIRLLDAATALGLVERRRAGRYGLGIHGAAFIANPALVAMVGHNALLYRDLADPVAVLRGDGRPTEVGAFWGYADRREGRRPADVGGYSALMASSLPLIADDILEAFPEITERRALLDVAGGEGAFLEAVASKAPHLELTLFDLPAVARLARERLGRIGLGRSSVVGGDVFADELPPGRDLVTLVRVVHDHDDVDALRILRAVRRCLAPGGIVLVAEPMAGTPGTETVSDVYFAFYLLAMGQGRARTVPEISRLLGQAGFGDVQQRPTRRPLLAQLLIARA